MARENYDDVIDQKLSELYDVLKALNTLKEKTAAVHNVVQALSEAGKDRIAEIETAVSGVLEGLGRSVDEANKSMASVAQKMNEAVERVGKDRIEGMRTTAEAFSDSLNKLVRSAGKETARVSKIVAELRGLPLVQELRDMREDAVRQAAELKAAVDGVGETAGKTISRLEKLSAELAEERKKISEVVSGVRETLLSESKSVSGKIAEVGAAVGSNKTIAVKGFVRQEKQIGDAIAKITGATDQLAMRIREARESLTREIGSETQRTLSAFTDARERIDESLGGLKTSLETSLLKVEGFVLTVERKLGEEAALTRKRIAMFGMAMLVAIVGVGVLVAPVGIAAWRTLLK